MEVLYRETTSGGMLGFIDLYKALSFLEYPDIFEFTLLLLSGIMHKYHLDHCFCMQVLPWGVVCVWRGCMLSVAEFVHLFLCLPNMFLSLVSGKEDLVGIYGHLN